MRWHAVLYAIALLIATSVGFNMSSLQTCPTSPFSFSYSVPSSLNLTYPLVPNTTCVYHIRIPSDQTFLSVFCPVLIPGDDSITFYDGTTTSSPFLGRIYALATYGCVTVAASSPDVTVVVASGRQNIYPSYNISNIPLSIEWKPGPFAFCSGVQSIVLTEGSGPIIVQEPTFPVYGVNETTGHCTAGSYHPNSNCSWLIHGPPGYYISAVLTATQMRIGDVVYFYDGDSTAAPLLGVTGPACEGQNAPIITANAATTMLVQFDSGPASKYSNQLAAVMSITFNTRPIRTQCVNNGPPVAIALDGAGTIEQVSNPSPFGNSTDTPDLNFRYQSNTTCAWHVTAPPGMVVEIVDTNIVLYGCGGTILRDACLSIHDGPNTTFSTFGTPYLTNSTGRDVYIVFHSGLLDSGLGGDYGFALFMRAVYPSFTPCSGETNEVVLASSGFFMTVAPYNPNFVGFPLGRSCTYGIANMGQHIVTLNFTDIHMGPDDSIVVTDGILLHRADITSESTSFAVSTWRANIVVVYTRGYQGFANGFQLEWTAEPYTTCSGLSTLFDVPGVTVSVALTDGLTCGWIIHQNLQGIGLSLTIDLRPGLDQFSLYEGTDDSAPLVAQYEGPLTHVNDYFVGVSGAPLYVKLTTGINYLPNQFLTYGSLNMSWDTALALPAVSCCARTFNPGQSAQSLPILPAFSRNAVCTIDGVTFPTNPNRTLGVLIDYSGAHVGDDQTLIIYDGDSPVVQCPGPPAWCGDPLTEPYVFLTSGSFRYEVRSGSYRLGHESIGIVYQQINLLVPQSPPGTTLLSSYRRAEYTVEYAFQALDEPDSEITLYTVPTDSQGATIGKSASNGLIGDKAYRYSVGQNNTILVSAATQPGRMDPEQVTIVLALQINYMDIRAGATVTIYHGETTDGPVARVWNGDNDPSTFDMSTIFGQLATSLLIVFEGPTDPAAPLGYGFYFSVIASTACLPTQTTLSTANSHNVAYMTTSWHVPPTAWGYGEGKIVLGNTVCTTTFVAPPGFVVVIKQDEAPPVILRDGDSVALYDGPSTSSPQLLVLNTPLETGGKLTTGYRSTGTTMTISFRGRAGAELISSSTQLAGFNFQAELETVPCAGEQHIYMFKDSLGTDFHFSWTRYARPNVTYTLPGSWDTYPSGLNCSMVLHSPPGLPVRVTIFAQIENSVDSLTIYDSNDRLVFSATHSDARSNSYAFTGCGGLTTVRFITGTNPPPNANRGPVYFLAEVFQTMSHFEGLNDFAATTDACRRELKIDSGYCPSPPIFNFHQALYENCTVIFPSTDEATLLSGDLANNVSFPHLRVVLTDLTVGSEAHRAFIGLPNLVSVRQLEIINATEVDLSSLQFASAIIVPAESILPRLVLPQLRACGVLGVNARADFSILAPVLTIAQCLTLRGQLIELQLGGLRQVNGDILINSGSLRNLDLHQLEQANDVCIANVLLDTIDLGNLFDVTEIVVITNCPPLTQILLSSLVHLMTLQISGNYFVTTLDLQSLTVVDSPKVGGEGGGTYRGVWLQNVRIQTLDLPSLLSAALILNDLPLLSHIGAPQLLFVQEISFTLLPLVALSFPVLRGVGPSGQTDGSVTLMQNFYLKELHMCRLISVGCLTVTQSPALSYQDVITLFGPLFNGDVSYGYEAFPPMSRYLVNPDDCSSDYGNFGCASNVTLTAACFTVQCIQDQIDASYSGQHFRVYAPRGVYTGCISLDTRGKALTVFGDGPGATIIDCQQNGRGMDVVTGEGTATEIRGITFMNGTANLGANLHIDGASPTFIDCEFSHGFSSAYGNGGVLVEGVNAHPVFINCHFHDNAAPAGNGGGVLVGNSASATFSNCTFSHNSASGQGGSLAFVGAAVSDISRVMHSTFLDSSAARGGGIYSDGALTLDHVTLRGNRASQFGGGLAAISTADLGTEYAIADSLFESNSALSGGGIFGFSANLDMRRVVLRQNEAGRNGGGGLAATCSQNYRILGGVVVPCEIYARIHDSVFVNNTANNNGDGGGLLIRDIQVELHNSSILENSARSGGGAYVTVSILNTSRSEWADNEASQNGGAFYCEPFTGICDSTNSMFLDNDALISGGATYFCTTGCPNMTSFGVGQSLPLLMGPASGNTYQGNMVSLSGYGSDTATDANSVNWLATPPLDVVSGDVLAASLVARVEDGFGSVVTSSTIVLTLSLRAEDYYGTVVTATRVILGGTQTAIADQGLATFTGVTMAVADTAYLNQIFYLSVRISELASVTYRSPVTIRACDDGQGRTERSAAVTCGDCAAGSAGSKDTDYVCVPCAAGSYADAPRFSVCTPCPVNTHAPTTGAITCLACPAGYSAPIPGSVECTQGATGTLSGLTSSALGGTIAGVVAAILVAIGCCAFAVFRLARRRTMQKYYLDNDATVRTGTIETPLQKEIKRILGAASTTRIGGGLYSNVYKAKYDNIWIALKVIKGEMATDATAQQEFRREAIALSLTEERDHPGIVRLVFYLTFNPMCIGIEFCRGGSLKRALANRAFPDSVDKVRLAAEAASAMAVIHSCGIVHLDLKTDNMLLSPENRLIVADFGVARTLGMASGGVDGSMRQLPAEYIGGMDSYNSMLSAGAGGLGPSTSGDTGSPSGTVVRQSSEAYDTAFTPQYVDPVRILFDKNDDEVYLKTADVFSFAMVMWAIMMQEEPYAGENPDALLANLRANPLLRPRPLPADSTPAFYAELMQRCWHENPSTRPTFVEVFQVLRDGMRDKYGVALEPGYDNPNLG